MQVLVIGESFEDLRQMLKQGGVCSENLIPLFNSTQNDVVEGPHNLLKHKVVSSESELLKENPVYPVADELVGLTLVAETNVHEDS